MPVPRVLMTMLPPSSSTVSSTMPCFVPFSRARADQKGLASGQEFTIAISEARACGAKLLLGDRDVQVRVCCDVRGGGGVGSMLALG